MDTTLLFQSTVVAFVTAVSFILLYSVRFQKRRERKKLEKAFSLLSEGFNSDVEIDESDIRLIYKNKVPNGPFSYALFLEEYLLYLRNGHSSEVSDFAKVNTTIKSIIEREQAALPYSGIDENKRRIMLSIEEAVQGDVSKQSVKRYLDDLTEIIRSTENNLKSANNKNNWSIPLAIIGVVFTFLSFFVGPRLSKKDYEKLDQQISTTIYESFDSLTSGGKTLNWNPQEKQLGY